jgi:alpha-glucosidase
MTNQNLWWKHGVVYQIYPRSFMDSNADGIGDLEGIISKLDYLQDLGIDAIWLSPIYPSPDADFGYDVADYRDIDPKFGTLESFNRFQEEAHKRNIKVIMDLVLNHSSVEHNWFVEARQSKDNPYRDYYIWADGKNGKAPNNWGAIFGGSAWKWDEQAQQYYLHMFYEGQPDLNWRNPTLFQEMMDIFKFWCDRGVDGVRLDVFNLYYKDKDLRDNPRRFPPTPPFGRIYDWQDHKYDFDQPEMLPALEDIRKILDSYSERYAIGETYPEVADTAATYAAPGRLHAAFNFTFLHSAWKATDFVKTIHYWEAPAHVDIQPTYVLGNHDVPRPATRYAKGEEDARMKVAAVMLLTLRGTPYIYYGDEIGQRDIPVRRRKDIQDPIGKHYFPFMVGRDGCRAPMQWDASPNAGFAKANVKPWLPVHKDHLERNVETQLANPNSLLNQYKTLIKLRKDNPALNAGNLSLFDLNTSDILAFTRTTPEQTTFVCLNFSNKSHQINLPEDMQASTLLYSTHKNIQTQLDSTTYQLQANEAIILRK